MKCDHCENPATVHLTERQQRQVVVIHLCEPCAWSREGLGFPRTTLPNDVGKPSPIVVTVAYDSRHHDPS